MTLSPDTDFSQDQPLHILASLNKEKSYSKKIGRRTFRLDFQLGNNRECNFLLVETDHKDQTMASNQTMSDLTKTAQNWMKVCKCASFWEEPGAKWYPRRLLDLQELRTNPDPHNTRIRLVESRDCIIEQDVWAVSDRLLYKDRNDRYVTLSHCWGNPKLGSPPPLSMTFENEERFKTEGIMVKELPKTFRDAVVFAAGLEKVGFIWIDSLCIRQPIKGDGENEEEQLRDWFEQIRHMGNVYRKAFLNISATAAYDTKGGLFFDPCPELLRENNIDVYHPEHPYSTLENGIEKTDAYLRCSLIDTSAWDDLVENAPVNQRAWVFQERLLAPRVLHFGYNQLAWECHEFNSSESYSWNELAIKPSGTDGFTDRSHLKHLTVSAGRSFREARLSSFLDRDKHIKDIYIYELWKKIVESYSRAQLTKHNDKLIALGGLAKLFQDKLFSPDHSQTYVAGLWSRHIESQLLWTVNEIYRGNDTYDNPGQRHSESGPSWSWASITTPHGITYSDITDYASLQDKHIKSIFFKVISHTVSPADPNNPFGMLKSAHILLAPAHLHAINLIQRRVGHNIVYTWHLESNSESELRHEYSNVHIDAPNSDTDIFGPDPQLYCMPGAYANRTMRDEVRDLYCLMLKYEGSVVLESSEPGKGKVEYRAFRRVGVTKVAKMGRKELEILREGETQEVICLR
ncbi:hypothetical protein COCMIDRAFT_27231 [Bipolaris oryzae ATCC 44560]|uniref:Heterokaryon incompatibility domain-containing protein n=1 Tax=Bipolaris oryzae ATCC 44560 TaxID=930090 RepID=W6ZA85_COCMI|nr:uncharacterized protein COCMIDRAFT_27231 [Bipolaris oryzae ATCC 44560]EUC44444.1 hypothetical protein COCMIDRAFT_27231 [Bipolaris oryzae ATCC 44560]